MSCLVAAQPWEEALTSLRETGGNTDVTSGGEPTAASGKLWSVDAWEM